MRATVINVFDVRVPPLRERAEDIPLLVDHFIRAFRLANGGGPESISAAALDKLHDYNWPGNVRELRNVVHRAAVLSDGKVIQAADLPPVVDGDGTPRTLVAPRCGRCIG